MKAEKQFIALDYIPKKENKSIIYKNVESGATIIFDEYLKMCALNFGILTPKKVKAIYEQFIELGWLDV